MQCLQCSGIFCHIELNLAYDFVKLWFVGDQSSCDIAFLMIKIKCIYWILPFYRCMKVLYEQ